MLGRVVRALRPTRSLRVCLWKRALSGFAAQHSEVVVHSADDFQHATADMRLGSNISENAETLNGIRVAALNTNWTFRSNPGRTLLTADFDGDDKAQSSFFTWDDDGDLTIDAAVLDHRIFGHFTAQDLVAKLSADMMSACNVIRVLDSGQCKARDSVLGEKTASALTELSLWGFVLLAPLTAGIIASSHEAFVVLTPIMFSFYCTMAYVAWELRKRKKIAIKCDLIERATVLAHKLGKHTASMYAVIHPQVAKYVETLKAQRKQFSASHAGVDVEEMKLHRFHQDCLRRHGARQIRRLEDVAQ